MGEDLKFIDFHQLQIENKKFVKDIDDRNKSLLDLKLESTTTVQTLNRIKKSLFDSMNDAVNFDRDKLAKTESLRKKEDDIIRSTHKRSQI